MFGNVFECSLKQNTGREIREAGNKTPIFRIETRHWVNNGSGSTEQEWCFHVFIDFRSQQKYSQVILADRSLRFSQVTSFDLRFPKNSLAADLCTVVY